MPKLKYFMVFVFLIVFLTDYSFGIIGGTISQPHETPHLLLITQGTTPLGGRGTPYCGGIIYDSEYIITSTSCTAFSEDFSKAGVYAGTYYSNRLEITEQNRTVDRELILDAIENPKIALYGLDVPFVATKFVQFITSIEMDIVEKATDGTLMGWGSVTVDFETHESTLRIVNMPIVSKETTDADIFLAGNIKGRGGIGGCGADTGSPFSCITEDRPVYCGLLYKGNCALPLKYDEIVRLDHYAEAIDAAIQKDKLETARF